MAEAALFSIAQTVIKQLGSKILEEAALLWGIGDDIKKLTDTLSSIQAVLLDAEEKSHSPQSHQLRLWLKELRQAVYDAEDLLDDFSIEVRRRLGMATASEKILKEVRSFFSSSNQVAYGLRIAHGIQAIRARLDDIAARREMFHLEVRPVESVARKLREQTLSNVPDMVVGREDDKAKILELLLQSSDCKDNVSMIPIVGIGGLGKTTLAQLVYNDEAVESHFEVKAWVCVSDNFDVKLIVEKIIESCTKKKTEDLEMSTLTELLHTNVKGKRSLIVLDDVWNEDREKWSRLKSVLKGGAEGSRVMVTTRLLKVAKLAAPRMEPYELIGLDESTSWTLFSEIAFEGWEVVSGRHELIGREIVGKCKGVPLAIKTVAGALSFKESESEWVAFNSKEMWEMDENENDIMPTLKLSYDHLPTHLKNCFAYCRLFPKDFRFDVKKLIQLWVAQGYVKSTDPSSQFDIGLEYFKSLLWRSFFQEAEKDGSGSIKSCKMHDLMHDLAIAVAGEEIVTLDISNAPNIHSHDARLNTARHAALDFDYRSGPEELMSHWTSIVNNAEKLRTLFSTNNDRLHGRENLGEITFSNTTSLRALDLSHFRMSHLSHTIDKLKHLRYLDLTENLMEMLPEEITELVNLEVLILEGCCLLKQLPKNTGKLSCLAHLGLDGCRDLECLPSGIGRLCCLRELPIFRIAEGDIELSASAAGLDELRYMNNLRGSLKIDNLKWVKNPSEGKTANLGDKQHLERLELSWGWSRRIVAAEGELLEALCPHPNLKALCLHNNTGLKCPSWLPSLKCLVEIKIVNCKNWRCLSSLDQLPFLAELELSNLDSLEWIESRVTLTSQMSSSSSFFPSLKSLKLNGCPNLKGWLIPADALPVFACASEVDISNCASITSIPHFSLQLERLTLYGGTKEMLKQIFKMPPAILPDSPTPCSCLKDIGIHGIDDLDTLPEETQLRSSSLQTLCITDCCQLKTLYPALPYWLDSLEELEIEDCRELDLCDVICRDDAEQKHALQLHDAILTSLSKVTFVEIPKLACLPEWLQLLPSLKVIEIAYCSIASIPEWLPSLTQLQDLTFCGYGKAVAELVAEDLHKVAHISFVLIDETILYSNGKFNEEWADNGEDYDDDDDDDDDDQDEEEDHDGHDDKKEEDEVEEVQDGDEIGDNEKEQVTVEKEIGKEEESSRLRWFLIDCATKLTTCFSMFLRCFEGSSNSRS